MKDNFEVGDEVVLRGTVSEASVEWHGKPVVLVSLGGSGACSVYAEDLEHSVDTTRVEVEAIAEFLVSLLQECPEGSEQDSYGYRKAYAEFYIKRLMGMK